MATNEQRLTVLEAEVSAIKDQVASLTKPRAWLDDIRGSMDEWPEFGEVLELGRAFRLTGIDGASSPESSEN